MSEEQITINDIEWTDHVLSLLSDDEKINGNPTTDGLRRIFEKALNCTIVAAESEVAQCPSVENERRATVVHTVTYLLNNKEATPEYLTRSVSGSADVYWGNCDKIYRNHPIAVAETRAEGRALRRALRLRKVVAAEELAKDIDDEDNNNAINDTQINFIDVLAKRLDINVEKFLSSIELPTIITKCKHDQAVQIIQKLSSLQQNIDGISDEIKGYTQWR